MYKPEYRQDRSGKIWNWNEYLTTYLKMTHDVKLIEEMFDKMTKVEIRIIEE